MQKSRRLRVRSLVTAIVAGLGASVWASVMPDLEVVSVSLVDSNGTDVTSNATPGSTCYLSATYRFSSLVGPYAWHCKWTVDGVEVAQADEDNQDGQGGTWSDATIELTISSPSYTVPAGFHLLAFVVDDTAQVGESSEANNSASRTFGTIPSGSAFSRTQRLYCTYSGSAYFAFIYDYSSSVQESTTPGFIGYDTSLAYAAQYPVTMTTHVIYLYDSAAGRYTQAIASLGQRL